jgi:hypothetical protein
MIEKKCAVMREKLLEMVKLKGVAISRVSSHLNVSVEDIFYEYMKGAVPESGVTEDGTRFFFHGLGCSVKNPNEGLDVEIEFGPMGNYAAFDRYTLCHLFGRTVSECDEFISKLESEGLIEFAGQEVSGDSGLCAERNEIDSLVSDRIVFIGSKQ